MANRKRTSLDALISPADVGASRRSQASPARKSGKGKTEKKAAAPEVAQASGEKGGIMKSSIYLPMAVYDQLQELVFEEQRGQMKRRKIHDYYMEGIDLLFKDRGLKSVEELTGKK